jgi:hypothetical protein
MCIFPASVIMGNADEDTEQEALEDFYRYILVGNTSITGCTIITTLPFCFRYALLLFEYIFD